MTEQTAQTHEFSYGTLGPEVSRAVVETYEKLQSCLRVSIELGCVSSATVSRVIRAAVDVGVIDPEVKRESGCPKIDREPIRALLERFPGYTIGQIANIAEVSKHTIYRTKKGA